MLTDTMPVLRHVVVLATVGRWSLLIRALESVCAQLLFPDRVVIVIDALPSTPAQLPLVNDLPIEMLSNRRTPGAAGAWNTALDHLARTERGPENVVLSFLDDDDWWAVDHLAEVAENLANDIDVVATPIVRYDERSPNGRRAAPPAALRARDYFVGNPGIQGSNLSVRLSTLLEAGGFDEALTSCTDRDVCIRLADIGARYRAAPRGEAHHDTMHGGTRLSDAGSKAKLAGLDTFFTKYTWRMQPDEIAAAHHRARALFAWTPTQPAPCPLASARFPQTSGAIELVVGTIVDGDNPRRVMGLLEDLARVRCHPRVARLELVLLQNGASDGFASVVERATELGILPWPVPLDAQRDVHHELPLHETEVAEHKTIAAARTLLHRFSYEVAKACAVSVVWILDDDQRIRTDLNLLVDDIARARAAGHDVLIGTVTGAPPLPVAAATRTQLVDLHAFLQGASAHVPDDAMPHAERTNATLREGRRDYYHDLARRETDRLETPFVPETRARTLSGALDEVLEGAPRILAGEARTRAIPPHVGDPLTEAAPSSLRGGNTLIFDIELLRDIPNLSPPIAGRRTRRSDMIWAAIARLCFCRRVVAAPIALEQDRSEDPIAPLDVAKLVDDILGYAFFRAFEETLEQRVSGRGSLTVSERSAVVRRMKKYAVERMAAFYLSFHRVRGLTRALELLLAAAAAEQPWWRHKATACEKLQQLVGLLRGGFTDDALKQAQKRIELGLTDPGVADFLDALAPVLQGERGLRGPLWQAWVEATRVERAKALAARHLTEDATELLGLGSEGVVLRSGKRVVKVFDLWTHADRASHTKTLQHLRLHPVPGALPHVLEVHDCNGVVVVEMAFEASQPYTGGKGPELVALLKALRAAGWTYTNIHPKNLRQTSNGLVLVDVGRSLEPATPEGEERMVRRALLSFRFAFRSDLDVLARRSVDSGAFPELVGWEHLLAAVRSDSPKLRLDTAITEQLGALSPRRVLDYGGGKPRATAPLGASETVVYDADATLSARWAAQAPEVLFLDDQGLSTQLEHGEPFDAVVCSLVLCTIDDKASAVALRNIRRLVSDDGCVLVAVCDPTSVTVGHTVFQHRVGTGSLGYNSRASYQKHVAGSAMPRTEHHRPLSSYRRAFARAGLALVSETTIDGVDVERFERVSELVLFKLRPLPAIGLRTTLLIKACGMEAKTLTAQVTHLATQLGVPRMFDEVVLLVDPHQGPFPRPYASCDIELLLRNAAVLVAEGVVDRVIHGPHDGCEATDIAQRWFGVATDRAHCFNGQPTLGILGALDDVRGDLVLHADADLMLARPNAHFDLIGDAVAAFEVEPRAVTLSLPVHGDTERTSRSSGDLGAFRVDASAGWINLPRLRDLRPLPNTLRAGQLLMPWHRSVDQVVRDGRALSLRRGGEGVWVACPDNGRKHDRDQYLLLLDRMEANPNPRQTGSMDVLGTHEEWLAPKRHEPIVVVISGRNVSPGRITRCLESLFVQQGVHWGAVIVDDGSDNGSNEVVRRAVREKGSQVTVVRRSERAGLLANTVLAIRSFCADPRSIIVLLDMDDALGRPDALSMVQAAYAAGADVTVGSMVRTDKEKTYPVNFAEARNQRGGNVWQHLRSFRKALFDRIDLDDLRLDGAWIEQASDWAFMLPIVEMAANPVWIREPIYLHEPTGPRDSRTVTARETTIGRIAMRPSYKAPRRDSKDPIRALTVLCYHRVVSGNSGALALYARREMLVSRENFTSHMRALGRYFQPVTLADVSAAARGEKTLPLRPVLVTFDDGYRDLLGVTSILARAGIPAVAHVRKPKQNGLPTWAPLDLLYQLLGAVQSEGSVIDSTMRVAVREAMLTKPHAEQIEDVLNLGRRLGVDIDALRPQDLYLDAGALSKLCSTNVTIAAHGVDHVRWTSLPPSHLSRTLSETREWLATLAPEGPLAVAYPDGAVDARVADATGAAGFDLAFGLHDAVPEAPSHLCIRRVLARDDGSWIDKLAASMSPGTLGATETR